ncbi:MAG TPA: prephenate dehydrogenase/arogenate dehydrogenase family protein [Actinomycetota bacterium]|nr:prephenate dehydrogenase/arogenate dehydrogenase family protein [Actinomycetota bacterium]
MTSSPPPDGATGETVAVIGAGLVGTSVALAAARAGASVRAWDVDRQPLAIATRSDGITAGPDASATVRRATIVVVATPIAAIARCVVDAIADEPDAVVTDAGSIKTHVVGEATSLARERGVSLERFVPGHPMGGSERSGPAHASAAVVDGIVWAVTPTPVSSAAAVARLESFVRALGARPVRLEPARHDRLVATVSHLPQVASTALMSLAAAEEADEPDILLLAAGGFRDLTRLAASSPHLWSEILLANRTEVARAIDLYVERLERLRDEIREGAGTAVERIFDEAKGARLGLAAKPQVRAGVAVLQVPIPDRPGALAVLTGSLADAGVNIEDLQIVHSPEGGRGLVHLTVAVDAADGAVSVLASHDLDALRLA